MGLISTIKKFFNTPFEKSIQSTFARRFSIFNRTLATNETIFSAVGMLSNGIASVPFFMLQEHKKLLPSQENIAKMLKYGVNPRMTMFNFMKTMEVLRCTKGVAYAIKELSLKGEVENLWIIDPDCVEPIIEDSTNELYYKVSIIGDEPVYVHNSNMIAVTYMTTDGYTPINPLDVLKNTVDYDKEVKEFSLNQMENGLSANIIVKTSAKLNEEAIKTLNDNIARFRKNGILYVDAGKDFQELKNSYIDPNVFAVENITVERVERVFNMPGKLTKGSTQNSGTQDTEDLLYLKDAILPIIRMYEQEFTQKLVNSYDRDYKSIEIKGNMSGFARATMEKRGNFYQQMLRCGVFSPNQILELEDMSPYEGGDKRYLSRDLCPVEYYDEFIRNSTMNGNNSNNNQ